MVNLLYHRQSIDATEKRRNEENVRQSVRLRGEWRGRLFEGLGEHLGMSLNDYRHLYASLKKMGTLLKIKYREKLFTKHLGSPEKLETQFAILQSESER